MKRLIQLTTALVTIGVATSAGADVLNNTGSSASSYYSNPGSRFGNSQQQSKLLQELVDDVQAMGKYLGYDLTNKGIPGPLQASTDAVGNYVVSFLLMYPNSQNPNYNPYAAYTSLAITAAAAATTFNPTNPMFSPYGTNFLINQFADTYNVFSNPAYNSTDSTTASIGVNKLVDQPSQSSQLSDNGYMPDPTSQAIQNIFTTPDITLCTAYDDDGNVTSTSGNCPKDVKSMQQLLATTTGASPSAIQQFVNRGAPLSDVFKGKQGYFNQFYSQLNANNLLSPLVYSTSANAKGNSPSQTMSGPIRAASQAQQAENFVRFSSGQLVPIGSPDATTLQQLGQKMASSNASDKAEAVNSWATYVANLTTYASVASVIYSNLNDMMAKRTPITLPSNDSSGNSDSKQNKAASQALYEYQMATWRLNDSTKQTSPAWLDSINTASPSSVAKEQLSLLAEINYQLYLNRQMQERILLTNSMILMQSMQVNRNVLNLTTGVSNPASTATSMPAVSTTQ